ncbi:MULTISPECIES: Leu/Phe/Val dehydrogenase [Pseudoalteromonas]|uniref:Leucine dehydrogenase n=1 Tax=Pseudoalteromonas carrageenovora IAM 12662 TaxID=1314868 RepID=A0A2K4X866_PSEVC|nr:MULTISPECIES: Glu/Leu/Phe/Val dehydrogenase [Pseudoalteromonas]KTF11798.1 amino acid dehydrogenase [Pseudoalteromonas sp. H103]MBE0382833.1 leucine dehydrogenase [Pseudoalteromonas carrageenovora IAM 12662]MCQ8888644.1 Glu/Leu/Phe/Val dehydrogenase [Pseudoalteromonas carrageenovora]MDO6466248.1 Glu/Leu/Phe/Val dehydrogenase [Pseudoalteromonas carrageenovora]MDO6545637.1 Glu/Leu/Phe/Val dehydrogenase [Pseudoalteromonas carrageenovora]
MAVFNQAEFDNHEQVVFCSDEESGLKAIIAVHNTNLGPAVGGCRMWDYANDDDAVYDVLRLAKGMTYKNAVARLPFGGGKSVIIGNAKEIKSEQLFRAFGRKLEGLGGSYYCAEDVNITCDDVALMNKETNYVLGLEGKSGNPSPFTAYGTFLGIKAALQHQRGHQNFAGIKVAVQGLGSVAYALCKYLSEAGAELFVTDINQDAIERVVNDFNATAVGIDEIYDLDVDVYAPCALGATINDLTIPRLKATIIAGCANNQLAESRHGEVIREKGILYAPDYVINAGGIINVYYETAPEGYSKAASNKHVEVIFDTLTEIFARSEKEQKSTHLIADELAQEIIKNGL